MAIDPQPNYSKWIDSPAENAETVTPSNSVDITYVSRALYIGSTGDVKVDMKGGQTVTLVAVPAGAILPIRVTRVYATGTTASSIIALY